MAGVVHIHQTMIFTANVMHPLNARLPAQLTPLWVAIDSITFVNNTILHLINGDLSTLGRIRVWDIRRAGVALCGCLRRTKRDRCHTCIFSNITARTASIVLKKTFNIFSCIWRSILSIIFTTTIIIIIIRVRTSSKRCRLIVWHYQCGPLYDASYVWAIVSCTLSCTNSTIAIITTITTAGNSSVTIKWVKVYAFWLWLALFVCFIVTVIIIHFLQPWR